MSVRVAQTSFRPEMFGTVVDMPTPTVYVIETKSHGFVTIHDDEITEFFSE